MKERADKVVVDRGLAESRQKAQALIMAGRVFSDGERIEKPGQKVNSDQQIMVKEQMPYVSRGGLKLSEVLDRLGVPVSGKIAADLGSSTGGFTDCLLQKGARKVYAVDVDTKQLDWRLREDSRVVMIEKNARYLDKNDFADPLDIITADLSFISVLKVLPAIKGFIGSGLLVALIKPQFEAGKGQVGKKGVIRDPRLHEMVLIKMIEEAEDIGFHAIGLVRSPILGQKGNREFFLLWTCQRPALTPNRLKTLIKEAVWNEQD
ncbi:MAG: TlyA family RNA methyltransferase [Candidatus Aminicenantes bacterium]|nr:MAG: TlyA family RNA methyltransferase [Candidatus Aminicenantes bacterium]